jgi:hypothetical protein
VTILAVSLAGCGDSDDDCDDSGTVVVGSATASPVATYCDSDDDSGDLPDGGGFGKSRAKSGAKSGS